MQPSEQAAGRPPGVTFKSVEVVDEVQCVSAQRSACGGRMHPDFAVRWETESAVRGDVHRPALQAREGGEKRVSQKPREENLSRRKVSDRWGGSRSKMTTDRQGSGDLGESRVCGISGS